MQCTQALAQLAEQRLAVAEIRDAQLDHLAGVQVPQRITGILEPDRAGDQPPSGAVGEPPLADTRPAGRVEKMAPVSEPVEHAVQLSPGAEPADETAA